MSAVPVFKQIAWLALIPQVAVLLGFVGLFVLLQITQPHLYGIVTYFLMVVSLRLLLPRSHRKGVKAAAKGDYQAAIGYFENSHQFFNRHNWVDKWRYLTLLSSSRISYREMALLNMAFCYGQLKNGEQSKALYRQVLLENPQNRIALTALAMYEAAAQ